MIDLLIGPRAAHLAATAITAGALFFDFAIARPVLAKYSRKNARGYLAGRDWLIWTALAISVFSGFLWALLLAAKIGETSVGQTLVDGTFTTLLTDTRFGQVWIARAILTAVIAWTLVPAGKRFAWVGVVCALLLLTALAWVGHAGARPGAIGWLHVCADMGHLLAAGAWLGSLPVLALLLAKSGAGAIAPAAASVVIRRFSTFGVVAVATLLMTGGINAWLLTDSVAGLTETAYGRLLLGKIGLFVAMLVFASTNRWYWTPRLPAARAIEAIRRLSLVETSLGLIVMCIVGVLGTLALPVHQHSHGGEALPEAAFVHIHDVKAMADVTILPGRAGPSEVWLRLMRDDFSPLAARSVTVRLSYPGQKTVVAEARIGLLGLWRASDVMLPAPGIWTIVVEIQTDDGPPLSLDAPCVLEP